MKRSETITEVLQMHHQIRVTRETSTGKLADDLTTMLLKLNKILANLRRTPATNTEQITKLYDTARRIRDWQLIEA